MPLQSGIKSKSCMSDESFPSLRHVKIVYCNFSSLSDYFCHCPLLDICMILLLTTTTIIINIAANSNLEPRTKARQVQARLMSQGTMRRAAMCISKA